MSPRCRSALFAALTLAACQPHSADSGGAALTISPTAIAGATATAPPIPLTAAASDPQILASSTTYDTLAEPAAAPFSLTASDGSGLQLSRVDAHAVVEGPLAFTELHLYFHNPEQRTREGTFSITLPSGAAISRFAMEQNGQWQEAEVVESAVAHRAYEDFLHRRQDPALLEKAAGNEFSARVFPIAAGADKHIIISFSQEVVGGRYVLPLRGLAATDRVDARVDVARAGAQFDGHTLSQRNWKPDRDFVVAVAPATGAPAIVADRLVAARVKVAVPSAVEAPSAITLLVDTSASRALGFASQVRGVRALVASLARQYGGALPIQVVAFDQDTLPVFDGRADGFDDTAERALLARGALGASDLGQALAWVGAHGVRSRVIILSDGMVTAGVEADALPALARQLSAHQVERIDVALIGGIRDNQLAASIAHAGLPHTGAVLDLDAGVDDVAKRVGLAVRTELPIAVDGAIWTYPRTIAAAQDGDEVTVFARLANPSQQLGLAIAGVRQTLTPLAVEPVLLGRALAGAEINELEGKLALAAPDARDVRAALRADIVKRSIAARVVSSQTAMLVLETDADYARYGIDRTSLGDILVAGTHGVELAHRAPATIVAGNTQQVATPAKPTTPAVPMTKVAAKEKTAELAADKPAFKQDTGGDMDGEADARTVDAKPVANTGAVADPSGELDRSKDIAGGAPGGAAAMNEAPKPEPVAVATPAPPPPPSRSGAGAAGAPRRMMARGDSADDDDDDARPMHRASVHGRVQVAAAPDPDRDEGDDHLPNTSVPALTGPLADIMSTISHQQGAAAVKAAVAWHDRAPGDVLGLIGLGEALEATHDLGGAARAYGSIIDLYPARADFRRFAGERLERLGAASRALAIDTYRRAVAERADHLTGHRLLAYALLRAGDAAGAFDAILAGLDREYPDGRYLGGKRVLGEDAGMIAAALIAKSPARRAEITAKLARVGAALPTEASTRFILYWETDDNDVDFHIQDAHGGHAYYANKQLRSGGELYEDITTGYGPECFTINGHPKGGPYHLSINYFSQGPMGYGMGLLQVLRYDGKGGLNFEDRPYVIMTDHAFVDLGTFKS